MRSKDSTGDDGPEMERISDGKIVFSGTPRGVTASGGAVLYTTGSGDTDGTLVNLKTGENILDVSAEGELPMLHMTFGVIQYSIDDLSSGILLPGA